MYIKGLLNKLCYKETILYIIISYPLFYFSYKYGNPDIGGLKDFYSYYSMYKSWDFTDVQSPFNMRLISSFLVYLVHKTGLFYSAGIAYQHEGIETGVYFSALLVSYISVVFTCVVVFKTVYKATQHYIISISSGILYLLGFGTLFHELSPLTDSFSVFLFSLFFHFYFFHKYYAIPILFLSVFQREYIFFLAGLISLFDIIFNKKNIRYYTVILVSSVIFFGVYFVLRKTLFFTPKYSSQLAVGNYLERIINPGFAWGEYFRQTFLMQNTLFLYFGIILYKKIKKIRTNNKQVALVLLALLQAVIISFMAVLGNSAGRYFYIFCPAILVYIALETFEIINKKNDINNIS